MARPEKSYKELQAEITVLRQKVADLEREKTDIEILMEMSIEHGDYLEEDLLNKVESTLRESERRFRLCLRAVGLRGRAGL